MCNLLVIISSIVHFKWLIDGQEIESAHRLKKIIEHLIQEGQTVGTDDRYKRKFTLMLKWKFSGFNFRNVMDKIEAMELFGQSFPNSQSWKT